MSKWGRADYKELVKLKNKLEKVQKVDYDNFCEQQIKRLAQRMIRRVVKRTPSITGELKRAWTIGKVVKRSGCYEIEIVNMKMYVSYVEYGHRQLIGRFVPTLGKRLVKGWVEGRFMLTITEKEIERDAPKILKKEFEKFIGDMLNGK